MIEYKKLIEPLTLSVRTENPLKRAGIRTLAQLIAHSEQELLRLPFFGRKSLRELEKELEKHGYSLAVTPTPRMQAAMQTFDDALKGVSDPTVRQALIDVGDTCRMARNWFHDAGITPTAHDLIYWCDVALARETSLRRRDEGWDA